jgi:drug/metabolite transporter (DMT)-like permease
VALIGSVLTAGVFEGSSGAAISPLSDPAGLIAGVLTGAWYAVYILVGNRVIKNVDPLWVSSGVVAGSLFAFAILAGFEFFEGDIKSAHFFGDGANLMQAMIAIGGLAVFSTVLPFATLYAGMKRVGAVRASLLSTLELVFTLILASLFLDETLTPSQWVGAGLILLSVLLTSRHGRE